MKSHDRENADQGLCPTHGGANRLRAKLDKYTGKEARWEGRVAPPLPLLGGERPSNDRSGLATLTLLIDVATVDPCLHTNDPVRGLRFREAVIDVRA